MTPQSSAWETEKTSPNAPAVPLVSKSGRRLTAQERAALTPTVAAPSVEDQATHLAIKNAVTPHSKPIRGVSIAKVPNKKAKKTKGKAAAKTSPAPKQKAVKAPAEPKAPRVPGTISPHPEQAKGEMVPVDVSVRREDLDRFRASLAKGSTFGETVRQWWADRPSKNIPQALPAGGMTRRTIYLGREDVKSMTAFEAVGTQRVSAFIHARLVAANAK
jgi:hypothetical protein